MKTFRHRWTCILAAAAVAACASDTPGPTAMEGLTALAVKAGGTRTLYEVRVEGDFTLPAAGQPAPRVTRSSSDPFANSDIVLENVVFAIGPVGPSGDPGACTSLYPNAFGFTNQDAWPTHWNGNEGDWHGEANFSEKRQIFNVSGTRVDAGGGTEGVQSSQSMGMTKAGPVGGVWSLTFTNALQYFGGNSTRYDGMYRCVNFKITLTPVP